MPFDADPRSAKTSLPFIEPLTLKIRRAPFDDPDWLFELKHDGFRGVLKSDVPGTNYETVLGMAEIAANTDFASHTHPGTESSYVVEGGITLNVKGQPTREVKAGESIFIRAETPHSGRAGPNGAKILAAWVVEKGKPIASPAEPFTAAAK